MKSRSVVGAAFSHYFGLPLYQQLCDLTIMVGSWLWEWEEGGSRGLMGRVGEAKRAVPTGVSSLHSSGSWHYSISCSIKASQQTHMANVICLLFYHAFKKCFFFFKGEQKSIINIFKLPFSFNDTKWPPGYVKWWWEPDRGSASCFPQYSAQLLQVWVVAIVTT